MGKESILIGSSYDIPRASFVVVRVERQLEKGQEYLPKDMKEIFVSDGGEASLLFGWGIAVNSEKTSKTMIVFNPNEDVTLPDVDDEY